MLNFEGVSKSYDLFGTNQTSPEIPGEGGFDFEGCQWRDCAACRSLDGSLGVTAGKKGEHVEVKFQFGKVFWKWDMMDLKMFRNYVFHLEIMFVLLWCEMMVFS